MPRSHEIRIRFSQLDSAGVMFFARYFSLAHDLYEDLLLERGFSWREWFASPRFAAPIRSVTAEFFGPLRGGDVCRAAVSVGRIGRSSAVIRCVLDRSERRVAEMRFVIVFVSRRTGRAIAIPPRVRRKLAGPAAPQPGQRSRSVRRSSARRTLPSSERGIAST